MLHENSTSFETDPEAAPAPVRSVRPRIWTVFFALVAAMTLIIMFGALLGIVLVAVEAARGEDLEEIAQELPGRLATVWGFMLAMGTSQVAIGLVAIVAALLSPVPLRTRLGLIPARQEWPVYPLTILGSWAVLTLGLLFALGLTLVLPVDAALENLFDNMRPADAVPFVLFIAIAPGVCEELLFRGYVQRRLLERWRPATAITVTSVLFALFHLQPHHVALAFPLGLWLGFIAWRTGSVIPSIFCHAFVNGSLNAWRMIVKFGDVPEGLTMVVPIGAICLGILCFLISLLYLTPEEDAEPKLFVAEA